MQHARAVIIGGGVGGELFDEWVGFEIVREPQYDSTNQRIRA